MVCPTCKNVMIVVEYNRIELDYCPRCQGVWFDSAELELLVKSTRHEAAGQLPGTFSDAPEAASDEKKRKCPICHQKMMKVTLGQPPILIDACRRGDGLWFDGGEVDQLLKQLPQQPDAQPVAAFLGRVFQAGN